jgi:predicted metal-dependent peptidase
LTHVHYLVYGPIQAGGTAECHCTRCSYQAVVPVTFDAILESLNKNKRMKHGYVIAETDVQARNHRQAQERQVKKARASAVPRKTGNKLQNIYSRISVKSCTY